MSPVRVTTFTNTFLVASDGGDQHRLRVVGPEEARKKRPHRVKCDEGEPCSNCVKRKESCIRRSPPPPPRVSSQVATSSSMPREISCSPISEPECSPINLLHMELLHHFDRWTIPTLAFKHIWPSMLQLAFQVITSTLIHYLMWCDLSFMDSQSPNAPLDLSGDRLYYLSTGVRQVFFQAWQHFQQPSSLFSRPGLLQPCMAIEDVVEAKGLNWQRYVKGFMGLYDNPRYHGNGSFGFFSSASSSSRQNSPFVTLWHSYTEGVAYLRSGGIHDEALLRAAYKRLVSRLAVAMAYLSDRSFTKSCPFSAGYKPTKPPDNLGLKQEDVVRYVLTISMMCFGPLLQLIREGDSRMLILLLHIYRVVGVLLPPGRGKQAGDEYWWCRRRVVVMEEVIGREMKRRGVEVCLRRQGEVV
ncbi:hypothetical protein B0T21DRAFT_383024 [Apiosordaria backusii]|uniref:Zn(2)-C6 fungal-type domain-containing protein n=1 Tax=Apiosordaria backusii TaxID=314023 RepID=A0AA40BMN2_9PEZI|nr:hypothetical protein B0T21DRAFT_383024 [Apiosordaria backusii]